VSALSIQGWAHAALGALGAARPEIDALNVFPVPDGDTGTNVYLTMEAACTAADAAASAGSSRWEVAAALAQGAMLGARGNSGVILSEYLRGASHALRGLPDTRHIEGAELAAMLAQGAVLAYRAVSAPVEGTILTVARAAADAAVRSGADAVLVAREAAEAAQRALAHTPSQLPALAAAGVVDAGGRALVVILDALVAAVGGQEHGASASASASASAPRPPDAPVVQPIHQGHPAHVCVTEGPGYHGPAYEVMYLLHGPAEAARQLQDDLQSIGDSVLVAGDGGLWRVHAHVDDAGAAIEAALTLGRRRLASLADPSAGLIQVTDISVTSLEAIVPAVTSSAGGVPSPLPAARALIAVVHGPGIAEFIHDHGVHPVWAEPDRRPSTAELLEAIARSGADEIMLLPSDRDTQSVAELAAGQARRTGTRVAVIPTRAVVQSLAAIAVHDPSRDFDDDAVAMTRAAGATRYAAVTVATKQALTTAGQCQVGDALGVVDADIALIGASVEVVARGILDAMLASGGELVTLVLGADVEGDFGERLSDWLATAHPTLEVSVLSGGQPRWPLIIGVE